MRGPEPADEPPAGDAHRDGLLNRHGDDRSGLQPRPSLVGRAPAVLRGRGWALLQAVIALPYYWETNPGIVRQTSHALAQVLDDASADGSTPDSTPGG